MDLLTRSLYLKALQNNPDLNEADFVAKRTQALQKCGSKPDVVLCNGVVMARLNGEERESFFKANKEDDDRD